MTTIRATFPGHGGHELAARLDIPETAPKAWAVFAHCFTCTKDVLAARRIGAKLARLGLGVLRFDFTGLGSSAGEFASTDFSSNVEDLVRACDWLSEHHGAPALLVGHSLGGAAVLCAGSRVPSVQAIATIGAPSDVAHVLHQFGGDLDAIERDGEAEVSLAGRPFRIARSFVEDARAAALAKHVAALRKPLLVMHSPIDATVGIDNATAIFTAAKHPKSFVSLDDADHLLTREADARFAASVISGWAGRYLPVPPAQDEIDGPIENVRVTETGNGKFQQVVQAGAHRFLADEPKSYGGDDTGPSPYDLLAASLGACTTMTLRMYASRKGLDWSGLSCDVSHAKVHASDCAECSDEQQGRGGKIDRFERVISVVGENVDEAKVLEIADKCPVHRTLHAGAAVATRLKE